MMKTIAIIGAGPYGLSLAAHLRENPLLKLRVFGEPMSFWRDFMPKGMFLRSGWRASHLSDPHARLTLDAYKSATGDAFSTPVPLGNFVSYGRWFQAQAAPEVDPRKVASVAPNGTGFRITLSDGEQFSACSVVVAAGISSFAWRPPEFANLPAQAVSHSSEHTEFTRFSGKRVAIIGGGQSALESSALLQEAGARVEVFVRKPRVHYLGWRERFGSLPLLSKLLYSWTDVGPAGISQLVARPNYFRRLPRAIQTPLAARAIRPAGAAWLRPRLRNSQITLASQVTEASTNANGLLLKLGDHSSRHVDHVLLATGYRVDCRGYDFLSSEIKDKLHCARGYPVLHGACESSVPGLHFVGAPAAWSYGPLMRFVAGTHFTCRLIAASFKERR